MDNKEINFKKELEELDKTINQIESGELSLDESIKAYEKGQEIIKKLESALKNAEAKVEQVIDTKGK